MNTPSLFAASLCLIAVAASGRTQAFPPATPESQGIPSAAIKRLDTVVQGYVDEQSIVGGELMVVKNRKTVFHKAYGLRDKEVGQKMAIDTIFNIRSMTKPLTGAALQMLIEDGKVALDDPVSKYLDEFDTDTARTITVRQLLTHRSGLPLTVMSSLDQYKNLHEVAAAAGKATLEFAPGERFFYSDAGSDCVAALIERISGEGVPEFVTKRLFKPLGMDDAFYVWDASKKDRLAPLYGGARGRWTKVWDASKPLYPFAWGSQTVYCTTTDYAKFLAMWMDRGRAHGEQVLSEATLKRGLAPVSEMLALGGGRRMPTGFFGLDTYYGELAQLWSKPGAERPEAIGHTGSDGTMAWCWPDQDLIVCFFTQSRGMSGALRIETVLDATLLGKDTVPAPESVKPFLGTYLANFGVFRNEEFRIEFVNGRLAIDIPSQLTFPLEGPDGDGRWTIHGSGGQQVSFSEPKDGQSQTLVLHAGPQDLELPRGRASDVKERPLTQEDVQKFLGKYRVPEDGSIVEIKFSKGSMILRVESAGIEVPLLSVQGQPNVWLLNGTLPITFEESEGKVVAFSATMPDGKKLRRTKIDEDGQLAVSS